MAHLGQTLWFVFEIVSEKAENAGTLSRPLLKFEILTASFQHENDWYVLGGAQIPGEFYTVTNGQLPVPNFSLFVVMLSISKTKLDKLYNCLNPLYTAN